MTAVARPTRPYRAVGSAAAALLLAGSALLAGCAAAEEPSDADVAFAVGMVPHHAQAVEMSRVLLAKDDVPAEVRQLAEAIEAAQQPEIDLMEGWLADWEVPVSGAGAHDHGSAAHGHADGMLSHEELEALEAADGPEATRLFLEGMVAHHEGAVTMAEQVLADGTHPEVQELAEAVVRVQEEEIHTMEHLLER